MKPFLISTFAAAVICCSAFGQELKPGDVIWEFEVAENIYGKPIIDQNNIIYFGTANTEKYTGNIYALNGDTGGLVWKTSANAMVFTSLCYKKGRTKHGTLYCTSFSGDPGMSKFITLGSKSGNVIRSNNLDAPSDSSPSISSNGLIYFGAGLNMHCADRTGKWNWTFKSDSRIWSKPAIGRHGEIYFGTEKGLFYSIDGETGQLNWSCELGGRITSSPAIGKDGTIYISSNIYENGLHQNNIYAVNKMGSKIMVNEVGGYCGSPIIGYDDIVYFGGENIYTFGNKAAISLFRITDKKKIEYGDCCANISVAKGKLFYITSGSKLYAVKHEVDSNADSFNKLLWEFEFDGGFSSPLAINEYGNIFLGTRSGKLICIKGNAGLPETPWPTIGRDNFGTSSVFHSFPKKISISINGELLSSDKVEVSGTASIKIHTILAEGEIFYTLDETKPTFTSTPYTAPFQLTESATIRAIAYSADFTNSVEAEPVTLGILPTYSMNVSTVGGGTAIIDPPHGPYLEGAKVTVTAKPEGDWEFIGWEGDSTSSDATITITMDEAKALTPTFGTNVTLNEIGAGKVVQTPSNPVPYGITVTFTAKPDTGHYFFRWAGEQKGNDNPVQLRISKPNPAISALFAPSPVPDTIQINAVSKTDSPFTISFESKSGATYVIEVTQDLNNWSKLGEVKGTSGEVKFTDSRLPKVPYKQNYFRVKLVE